MVMPRRLAFVVDKVEKKQRPMRREAAGDVVGTSEKCLLSGNNFVRLKRVSSLQNE